MKAVQQLNFVDSGCEYIPYPGMSLEDDCKYIPNVYEMPSGDLFEYSLESNNVASFGVPNLSFMSQELQSTENCANNTFHFDAPADDYNMNLISQSLQNTTNDTNYTFHFETPIEEPNTEEPNTEEPNTEEELPKEIELPKLETDPFHFVTPISDYQQSNHLVKDINNKYLEIECNDSELECGEVEGAKRGISIVLLDPKDKDVPNCGIELNVTEESLMVIAPFEKKRITIKPKLPNLGNYSKELELKFTFYILLENKMTSYASKI